jgi:hypothetical protein
VACFLCRGAISSRPTNTVFVVTVDSFVIGSTSWSTIMSSSAVLVCKQHLFSLFVAISTVVFFFFVVVRHYSGARFFESQQRHCRHVRCQLQRHAQQSVKHPPTSLSCSTLHYVILAKVVSTPCGLDQSQSLPSHTNSTTAALSQMRGNT